MLLTRFIYELYNRGICVYFMNGIFYFEKIGSSFNVVTMKVSQLNEYTQYLTVDEFVKMIEKKIIIERCEKNEKRENDNTYNYTNKRASNGN